MFAVRIAACLSLLAGFSLQVDVKSGKEAGKAGNFMEDEQWLSTISQYSRKIKHWNRFRDVSGVFLCVLFCFVVLPARVVVAVGALTSEVLDVCGGDGARRFWRSGDFLSFFFFFLRTVDWAQTHAQHEQFVRKKNTWDDQTLCLMTWLIHQHQLFLSPPTPLLRSHSFAADTPSLKLALLSMDRLMRELPSGVACDVTVSVFTDQYPLICHIAHTQCKAASDRKSHSETDIASVFPPDQTSSRKGNKHFFLPCRAAVQTSLGCGVTALFILRAARYKWPMNWTNLCINFPSLWLSEFGHLLVPSVRQEIKLLGFVRLSAIS